MKINNKLRSLFLAFLAIKTISAKKYGNFYTIIDGIIKPVSSLKLSNFHYLVPDDPHLLRMSQLTFENGIISNKNLYNEKQFGIVRDQLVMATHVRLETIISLQLDGKGKVQNLSPYLCKWPSKKFPGFFMNKNHSSKVLSCLPADFYFLSAEEAEKFIPEFEEEIPRL